MISAIIADGAGMLKAEGSSVVGFDLRQGGRSWAGLGCRDHLTEERTKRAFQDADS